MIKPFIPLGTWIPYYGEVCAVLLLSGERYYHLIDKAGVVSMMPEDALLPHLKKRELYS